MKGERKTRREMRQKEAQARQAEREARSDAEQFGRLMDAGHGHCREAERLAINMAEA